MRAGLGHLQAVRSHSRIRGSCRPLRVLELRLRQLRALRRCRGADAHVCRSHGPAPRSQCGLLGKCVVSAIPSSRSAPTRCLVGTLEDPDPCLAVATLDHLSDGPVKPGPAPFGNFMSISPSHATGSWLRRILVLAVAPSASVSTCTRSRTSSCSLFFGAFEPWR